MKLWLLTIWAGLCAGPAYAAGPLAHSFQIPPERPKLTRSFDLYLVQQPPTDPSPIHQSGMIARTGVAPNMDVGLGLFSARRNRLNPLEPKPDVRAKPSRKLGLSFSWRF